MFWQKTIFTKFPFLGYIKNKILENSKKLFKSFPSNFQFNVHNYITSDNLRFFKNKKEKIFDAIYFELRSRCNSTCAFCAASIQNEKRPDITMSFNLYEKIIDQLEEINYKGKIAFHVNNDPLLVKDIDLYVTYARKKCPKAWIQILTNGRSLNNKIGTKLLDAGINELTINVYSKDESFKTPKNVENFENDILLKKFSTKNIYNDQIRRNLSSDSINYSKISRKLVENLTNRAGSAPNKISNELPIKLGFCSYPFEQFNINANGDVSHCCADFYFSNKMGNLNDSKVIEIWNGSKFENIRQNLLNNRRDKLPMCINCDHYGLKSPPKSFSKKILFKLFRT